jgi:hypothetical protein
VITDHSDTEMMVLVVGWVNDLRRRGQAAVPGPPPRRGYGDIGVCLTRNLCKSQSVNPECWIVTNRDAGG